MQIFAFQILRQTRGRHSALSVALIVAAASSLFVQTPNALTSAHAQTDPLPAIAVSAATLDTTTPLAPGSLVALFGSKLANTTAAATDTNPNQAGVQLPLGLGGSTVRVNGQLAQLLFVSPQQINFLLPEAAAGIGGIGGVGSVGGGWSIEVQASDATISAASASSATVSPGIFTANGSGRGMPVGTALRVRADGTRENAEPLFTVENGAIVPRPLDLNVATDRLFLTLYSTGLRNAPDQNRDGNLNDNVRVLANGYETTPTFVGIAPGLPGVEQINWEVPRSFFGQARVTIALETSGEVPFLQVLEIPLVLPPLGAVNWRAAGLEGKRTTSLLSINGVALAGAEDGIYRTPSTTNDWRLVNYAIPGVRRINALFAVPNFVFTNTLLLAGLESGGSVLTSGGELGEVWLETPSTTFPVLNSKKIRAFAANATHVFAGGDDLSVARIRCCNQPWEQAGPVFAPRVNALATNGARIFAGSAANGLFTSNDNGNSWAQNNGGIPLNAEIRALLRPSGNLVLAGTANGLYRSTDNGASWVRVTEGLATNAAINALFDYGATLLAGTAAEGVLVSTDGGLRWQALGTGLTNQNVLALAADGARLLAGTTTGLYEAAISPNINRAPQAENQILTLNEDTTKTLTLAGKDPDGDPLTYQIVRGPTHGVVQGAGAQRIYAPEADYYGEDQFEYRVYDGKLGSRSAIVRFDISPINDAPQLEFSGDRLLLVGQFSNLLIRLGDPDWQGSDFPPRLTLTTTALPEGARVGSLPNYGAAPGYPFDTRRLVWVPTTPGTYTISFTVADDTTPPLTTTQSVTLRVADNPEKGSWTPVSSPIRPPRTDLIINLFAEGTDLYAATSETAVTLPAPQIGFWRSTDGGVTWKEANNGLAGIPMAFARAGNALFLGTDQGIFRSAIPGADGAPNWTPINSGLPALRAVSNIAVRGDKIVITTANALFLSTNQGASWTSINGNLPLTTPPGEQPFFTIASITSVVFNGDALFASIVRYPGALFATGVPDPAEVEAAFAAQASADETEPFAAQQTAPLQGVFRSADNGASWVPVNNGLGLTLGNSLLQYYSISNLTVSGTTLFANGALGLFRSTNQGDRWQRVPTPLPNLAGIPTFTLGALRQALETGQPGGTTQPTLNQIGLPLSFATFLPPIAVNGKLYLAPYGSGVYVSREDGSDWLPINQGLDEPAVNRFFAIGNRLYGVTSSLATGGIGGPQPISTRIFTRNLAAQ